MFGCRPNVRHEGRPQVGESPLVDVPSMEGLGLGFVANRFDVVPVRTNDESCIVVRVVVRAQTRRTIVFATRLQSRAIESFDLLAILGRERQVKMRRLLLGLVQAQRSLTLWAELDTVRRRPLRDNSYAERFECLEEERFARCIVTDSEFDVVKHEFSCLTVEAQPSDAAKCWGARRMLTELRRDAQCVNGVRSAHGS